MAFEKQANDAANMCLAAPALWLSLMAGLDNVWKAASCKLGCQFGLKNTIVQVVRGRRCDHSSIQN